SRGAWSLESLPGEAGPVRLHAEAHRAGPSRVMSGPSFAHVSTSLYSARSAPASVALRRIEELRYEHARRCRPIGTVPRHRHAALGFAPADRRTAPSLFSPHGRLRSGTPVATATNGCGTDTSREEAQHAQ